MGLKLEVDKLEDVEESIRQHYVQDGAKYKLDVEGAVSAADAEQYKSKVKEMRETNIRLMKEAEEAKKGQAGLIPIEKHRESVTELQTRVKALEAHLHGVTLEREVQKSFAKFGGEEAALSIVVADAAKVFVVEQDGSVVAKDAEGNPILSKTDPSKVLTLDEFIEGKKSNQQFLFKRAGGGASRGSKNGSGATSKNPFSKESWNLTEQIKLIRTNPVLARQLESEAN